MSAEHAARAVGASPSTLRRWRARSRRGEALEHRRGPARCPGPRGETVAAAESAVRSTRGLIGAAPLARQTGLSRRQAAGVKRRVLTQMEADRKARTARVTVLAPGAVRGFDALTRRTAAGREYGLIATDAAIPYCTSAFASPRYDADAVAAALEQDFAAEGAPLVLRLDRASAHRTPGIRAILEAAGTIALHGPARYPQFYGQHERQNRDYGAWLAAGSSDETFATSFADMRQALNEAWPRPALGYRTPAEIWSQRPPLDIDRRAFAELIDDLEAKALIEVCGHRDAPERARRLAIERALMHHEILMIRRAVLAN